MWVKNLSKEIKREQCYKGGKRGLWDIQPGEIFEVNSPNFLNSYSPTLYKEVRKPKKRYMTGWSIGIGCAIISSILSFLLIKFL